MPSLLRTGIRSLSVSAALVPDVKNAIRIQALEGFPSQAVKYKGPNRVAPSDR
jgi:phosphoenolpyruvate-protein kinase (PTS system EI component)